MNKLLSLSIESNENSSRENLAAASFLCLLLNFSLFVLPLCNNSSSTVFQKLVHIHASWNEPANNYISLYSLVAFWIVNFFFFDDYHIKQHGDDGISA